MRIKSIVSKTSIHKKMRRQVKDCERFVKHITAKYIKVFIEYKCLNIFKQIYLF